MTRIGNAGAIGWYKLSNFDNIGAENYPRGWMMTFVKELHAEGLLDQLGNEDYVITDAGRAYLKS